MISHTHLTPLDFLFQLLRKFLMSNPISSLPSKRCLQLLILYPTTLQHQQLGQHVPNNIPVYLTSPISSAALLCLPCLHKPETVIKHQTNNSNICSKSGSVWVSLALRYVFSACAPFTFFTNSAFWILSFLTSALRLATSRRRPCIIKRIISHWHVFTSKNT